MNVECRLRELTADALRDQARQIPEELRHAPEQALANLILMRAFGMRFWDREISPRSQTVTELFSDRWDVRVIFAADLVWRLRDLQDFEHFLAKNANRSFDGTYFELLGADMVRSAANRASFVAPCGKKGFDFDLQADDFLGLSRANIEIKSKRNPFRSRNALRNLLNDAREQLPKGGNGVVLCSIPPGGHYAAPDTLIEHTAHWMRTSTSRIDRVIFSWDPFEDQTLAIGTSYTIIGRHGVTDENIGGPEFGITFLRDAGIRQNVHPSAIAMATLRAGLELETNFGSWSSGNPNWWGAPPSVSGKQSR